jgi:hypothetical protein
MYNGKLAGISQYFYNTTFTELQEEGVIETLRWAIEKFFDDFRNKIHLYNVVFDVFIKNKTIDNESVWEVKLLEINPFCERTDPCLFSWKRDSNHKYYDLCGSFRYNKMECED